MTTTAYTVIFLSVTPHGNLMDLWSHEAIWFMP